MFLGKKIISKIFFTLSLLIVFFFSWNHVDAATLNISSNNSTFAPGEIMTMSVVLDTQGTAINSANAKILFPKDIIEVVSLQKTQSIFSLWIEQPSFSNIAGTINFNGGVPTPGFNGSQGNVLSFVVRAKKAGQANLIFSDASVRANDGLGTNVLSSKKSKTLNVVDKVIEPIIIEVPVPVVTKGPVPSLDVTSSTHPSQEDWYAHNNPFFAWDIPEGIDAVQTSLDEDTTELPQTSYAPAIGEESFEDVTDGIWYFKIRARQGETWGPVTEYAIQVDATPPVTNTVAFYYDDTQRMVILNADITDETSGVEYYDVYINNLFAERISGDISLHGYAVPITTSPKEIIVTLRAVDYAGNSIETTKTFTPPQEPNFGPLSSVDGELFITIGTCTFPLVYFVLVILLIILILIGLAFDIGYHSRSHGKLKHFTSHQKNNMRGLLLLRERLERHLKILQHTREERILLPEEKRIKKNIEDDLDEIDLAIQKQERDTMSGMR